MNLECQLANAKTNREIIEAVCLQHFRFERIHPFPDGNGRVGRALMVYTCLLHNVVPVVIPVNEKKRYINTLNTEDLPGFVDFCLELQQQETERITILQDDFDIITEVTI